MSAIHESVLDEIDLRSRTLKSGAPAVDTERGARTQSDIEVELAQLHADRELLLTHWRTQDGAVAVDEPPRARACGQAQPCPHVLGLAQKYGLIG